MPQFIFPNRTRIFWFFFLLLLSSVIFWRPLEALLSLSLSNEHYSHVLIIPVLSAYLLFRERREIFSAVSPSPVAGSVVVLGGIVLDWLASRPLWSLPFGEQLAMQTLSFVVIAIGVFLSCFGVRPLRTALFPLLLLLLAVPLPGFVIEKLIVGLQEGSAAAASLFFRLLGVPVLQEGFSFSLPGFTIQVAQECSGIRSSLALMITGLLAGHLFLRSWWTKTGLCLAMIPLAVVKNGFRIAALSWLGLHIDRGFLTGNLHRRGGVVFFLLSLIVLAVLLRLLQWAEGRQAFTRARQRALNSNAGIA